MKASSVTVNYLVILSTIMISGVLISSQSAFATNVTWTEQDIQSQSNSSLPSSIPSPQTGLTNVIVAPSNNLFLLESHYFIVFTTGTAGTIKTVSMVFPTGYYAGNVMLIGATGINPGTISHVGLNVIFTVSSPVSVPAGTTIVIELGKILNNQATSNTVVITTKNASNVAIDGPTTSPSFTLRTVGPNMIANGAITNSKITNGAINSTQIQNGAITLSKIAPNSVNSTSIVDGSITRSDISKGFSLLAESQQCLGKVVTGFDPSGNIICKSVVPDTIFTTDLTPNAGWDTSIAIGTDGFPVISYIESASNTIKLVHCTSTICDSWDDPITIESAFASPTSLKIGNDGFPVISYASGGTDPLGNMKLVHCITISCSLHDAPLTLDSSHQTGSPTSLAIGSDGFPVISYYDGANHDLKLVHCTNVSCSTHDIPITLDSAGDVGFYTSIAKGADGFPIISYYDNTNHDLKLVHCTNVSCSTHDIPITLDSAGDVGFYTSIAIGTDGFPVISYHDHTNLNLKLVHCTSISCSTHDTPNVLYFAHNEAGHQTSIAIGADGFPVISYINTGWGFLALLHCTNISCSTHDAPIIADVKGVLATYPSIAIGTDGFPIISYLDVTDNDLKVWHKGGFGP